MAKSPCLEHDCPILTTGTRCDQHTRERDRARGTRQQRSYDAAHTRLRADYQRRMDAGELFTCWRCAEAGHPHHVDPKPSKWHLGHDDHDQTLYRGPECAAGNQATSGRF